MKKELYKTSIDTKKEFRNLIFGLLFFGIIISVSYLFYQHDRRELKYNSKEIEGVIIGLKGVRGGWDIKFQYVVEGVKYVSSDSFVVNLDKFSVGDTCFVLYAVSNPENCKLVRNNLEGNQVLKLKKMQGNNPIVESP